MTLPPIWKSAAARPTTRFANSATRPRSIASEMSLSRNRGPMRRRGYIAVEGPIGVGKTSLAQALARELGARLILEDADNNPFIPRFYQDPDKYAFPAQLYFLPPRHNQQRELKQQDLFTQATVADYLFAKD